MVDNKMNPVVVYFDTLGCAKNSCDTTRMENILTENGCIITDQAELSQVIVLNTCAFIEAAAQESIDTFFEYRNFYKDKKIVVVGCLCSRYGKDLRDSLTEADAFLSCNKEDEIFNLIKDLDVKTQDTKSSQEVREFGPSRYIKISEGCDKWCSYCTIPFIRGKYRSVLYDEIKKEILECVSAKEIVLVAQDCGVWGSDFDNDKDLSWLLENLSNDFKNLYFRTLYIQPDAIDEKLLKTMSSHDNICNYIDMPLQHCNAEILKLMNRSGSAKEFLSKIELIRSTIPDCVLRTTFISGFPGETDEQFDELCDFLEKAQFDYAGCFEYSQEEGTKASKLPNQIDKSVKYSRCNKVREICDEISLNKITNNIGKTFKVLIEGFEEGRLYGRTQYQAPSVDGVVFISEYSDEQNIKIGDYVNVKIVDCEAYDLVGVINE